MTASQDIMGVKARAVEAFANDDQDRGLRPLEHYLPQFPGFAEVVASEYFAFKRIAEIERGEASGVTGSEPHSLGPYRIGRLLGQGGQGRVYEAHDSRLQRRVALKVLLDRTAFSELSLARFRREATLAAKLDHPGVCTVFDVQIEDSIPYIAMRFVEGESLASRISRQRRDVTTPEAASTCVLVTPSTLGGENESTVTASRGPTTVATGSWELVAALFEESARALHAVHEAGILHRDIKPGNLMITPEGRPVLMDFGLAADDTGEERPLTMTGELMGTPAYMSPEQLTRHTIRLDRRTDVWSLGATLYEALTLRQPFQAATRQALYQAILAQDPPDLRTLVPSLPRDLQVVVATSLHKDRARRYQTALALAEDLQRVREGKPILARPMGWIERLGRWARRNPALAAVSGALVLALVAGLAASLLLLAEVRAERDRYLQVSNILVMEDELEKRIDAMPLPRQGDTRDVEYWIRSAVETIGDVGDRRRERDRMRTEATADPRKAAALKDSERFVASAERLLDPDPRRPTLARARHLESYGREVVSKTVDACQNAWDDATRALADRERCPRYPDGMKLNRQPGLVPLGPDPESRLLEFAVWHPSWTIPERLPGGRIQIRDDSAIVLVLVPGIDASEHPDSVRLDPFFLSKYETTQAQWLAIMPEGRSFYRSDPGNRVGGAVITSRNPVESVSLQEALRFVRRLGLWLPTEMQWEHAARGRPGGKWWRRDEARSLVLRADGAGAGNFDGDGDGHLAHASVDASESAPSPFGFHHLLGNVRELTCQHHYWPEDPPPARDGDGLRVVAPERIHGFTVLGGSYLDAGVERTPLWRAFVRGATEDETVGFRVARALDP